MQHVIDSPALMDCSGSNRDQMDQHCQQGPCSHVLPQLDGVRQGVRRP